MSGLDIIIDPEIDNRTQIYYVVKEYLKRVPVKTIIECGASQGAGSTECLINGILNSPSKGVDVKMASIELSKARFKLLENRYKNIPFFKAYNTSSVTLDKFPKREEVAKFIKETGVHGGNIQEVLRWYDQDVDYVKNNGLNESGIQKIKSDLNINKFDLAFIDSGEFIGLAEFEELQGCDAYVLDDINCYKNWHSHKILLNNPNYVLLFEDKIRGGSSLFCKREIAEKYFIHR
jgi:hypothetical protein